MRILKTLSSTKAVDFQYKGSVKDGTTIHFGINFTNKKFIEAKIYDCIITRFNGLKVAARTSHSIKSEKFYEENKDTVGYWLYNDENGPKLDGQVLTSYICSILVNENKCNYFHKNNAIWLSFDGKF